MKHKLPICIKDWWNVHFISAKAGFLESRVMVVWVWEIPK